VVLMPIPDRLPLAILPTPLVRAAGLEQVLGVGPIWVKRDDLTGLGVAGNKARPLEFLLGDALAHGADVFVATGAPGSNFCAAAAVAARVAGLDCVVLHPGAEPAHPPTTVRLSRAAGATLRFDSSLTREVLDTEVHHLADELRSQGRRPYAVPRGGATAVGAVGFALAAAELDTQCVELGIGPRTVVLPTGSGATQAGLLAGCVGNSLATGIVGASVSRPVEQMRATVLALAQDCARLLGTTPPYAADVQLRDAVGDGFGVASTADRESAALALAHAGLLLDDTYTAKAMTLLRQLATERPGPFVFWHTGGVSTALSALGEHSAIPTSSDPAPDTRTDPLEEQPA
jgi:D-cysteine desulfhydrase